MTPAAAVESVLVVGAGLAGTAAAILLAEASSSARTGCARPPAPRSASRWRRWRWAWASGGCSTRGRRRSPRPRCSTAGPSYIAGFCPTGADSLYASVVEDAQDRSALTPDEELATMRKLAEAYHGPWDDIRAGLVDASRVNYTWFETHVLPPPWHRGRVVLLGDAAPTCPPTLAQGGAQALEDAAVLAELLLAADRLDDRLWDAFTARRFDRATTVVEASNQLCRWLLAHEQGDVPGLMPRVMTLVTEPAGPLENTVTRVITHLRHVDLAVPDFATQREFYGGTWGLTPEHEESGRAFLAAEGSPENYVVRLRQAPEKRIDLVAFGVATAADVDTLALQLARDGVQLVTEPAALDTPGGGYGFRFFDNEGRTVEVSADVATRTHRKVEEGESIPVRLSHVVLNSADPEGTRDFYAQHLAFALSDTLMHPRMGEMMYFMRVNAWHHSVAISRGPHPSLHHLSFELRGLDEYMRGTGRLLRAGVEKIWGPGRHKASNNTFTYFVDPQGNTLEYTTELELLDEDTWHPGLHDFSEPDVADQWGTANRMDEFVAARSFNDVDKGLFVAPPV